MQTAINASTINTSLNPHNTDNIEIKKVTSLREMRAVYKLHHDSYVDLGYIEPRPSGTLEYYSDYDWDENTAVFIAVMNNEIVGTISTSIVNNRDKMPLENNFLDIGEKIIDEKGRFGVIWRMITAPGVRSSIKIVTRLMNQVIHYNRLDKGIETLTCVVHVKHMRFYQRVFGSRQISDTVTVSGLHNIPVALLRWDIDNLPRHFEEDKERLTVDKVA